jgi:EAL domain-containing protein (putative c-di-GMP-specific phosphodiesterase class I)
MPGWGGNKNVPILVANILKRISNDRRSQIKNEITQAICGIRFQPIYSLAEQRVCAWEVLSILAHDLSCEDFFISLSPSSGLSVLRWQLRLIQDMAVGGRYFLNAPAKLFCHPEGIAALLPMLGPSIALEIQDPNAFIALTARERRWFMALQRDVKSTGAEIWLDDIAPEHLPLLMADLGLFDGIKIDKGAFWKFQSDPVLFTSTVDYCSAMTGQVLIEGIETLRHFNMAVSTGCHFMQGYLWPENMLNIPYSST